MVFLSKSEIIGYISPYIKYFKKTEIDPVGKNNETEAKNRVQIRLQEVSQNVNFRWRYLKIGQTLENFPVIATGASFNFLRA